MREEFRRFEAWWVW